MLAAFMYVYIIVQWKFAYYGLDFIVYTKGLLTHKSVTPCVHQTIENLWPVDLYNTSNWFT